MLAPRLGGARGKFALNHVTRHIGEECLGIGPFVSVELILQHENHLAIQWVESLRYRLQPS